MNPSREDLERSARRALDLVKDPRKAGALAAAGTAVVAARLGIRQLRGGDARVFDSNAYELLEGEPVGSGVKRVILARVDDAIAQLRGEAGNAPAEAIHEARKDTKKIRSALRLVRDELGDDVWRRENEHYRDVARALSGFRDAEILVEALDSLGERFGAPARERFAGLREQLEGELRVAREGGSIQRAMASAAAELSAGRARTTELDLDGDGWELIGAGLHRSYRRGRRRLRAVEEEASVTNLHELRKRVKDLWYQLRLIRTADPQLIGSLADHAHDLSDHLGDDHDLALLREQASRRRSAFADPGERRNLAELIDRRRGELQFAAISLATRIYAQKPKRFTRRYARAGQSGGSGSRSPRSPLSQAAMLSRLWCYDPERR
jgi:CHAD domain-containing protein